MKCDKISCKSEVLKTETYKTFKLRVRRCLKCYECFYTQEILLDKPVNKIIEFYESVEFKEKNELKNKIR